MPSNSPALRVRFLQLAGLASLALTQPLLELLSRSPELLIAHRATPLDLLAMGILPTLLPATLMIAGELVVGKLSKASEPIVHGLFVGLLVGLVVLAALRSLPLTAMVAISLAMMIAALAGWLVLRSRPLRLGLLFLWPAALVIPLMFWFSTGVWALWRPAERSEAAIPATATGTAATDTAATDTAATDTAATDTTATGTAATDTAATDTVAPVVVVIFDELPVASLAGPDGGLDGERLPAFAELARTATYYPRAFSVSDFTVQAVPAIFTGRYPGTNLLPIAAHHRNSLFKLLAPSHRMNVVESVTQVCPPEQCPPEVDASGLARRLQLGNDLLVVLGHRLLPGQLSHRLPPVQQGWGQFAGTDGWLGEWRRRGRADRLQQVERFLAGIDEQPGPALHLLHVLLPHPPFHYLPSGKIFSAVNSVPGLEGERWTQHPWPVTQARQRHLLQVGLVDRILGQITSRLRQLGIYDQAILVVTADHGVSHRPGEYRRHLTPENAAQILAVPLWIKAPGQQQPRIDPRLVESVDILPTIAALQQLELPWQTDGRPLTSSWSRSQVRAFPHRQRGASSVLLSAEQLAAETEPPINDPLALGPHPKLIGQPLESLELGPAADFTAILELPVSLSVVGNRSPYAPALVNGSLDAEAEAPLPAIAVAVDGIVRAVTGIAEDRRSFSALVGEQAFTSARDPIEAFVVEAHDQGLRLRPITGHASPGAVDGIAGHNLVPAMLGLEHDGFFAAEPWLEGTVRWTGGDAKIAIPTNPRAMPHELFLKVLKSGPRGARLRISANGIEIFDQHVPRLRGTTWQQRISLADLAPADRLELRLRSGTHVPRREFSDSEDSRRLGLALRELRLD